MAFWKYVRPGPGVAFVQKVSVTGPLEDEPPPLLLPPPAQAEAARATPRPSAAIAAVRVLFIIVETPRVNLRKPGADRRMPARSWRRDSRVPGHKLQFRRLITVSDIRVARELVLVRN